MGQPVSLLGQARAFARDFPRDQMPKDFLWDVLDFVPSIIDAPLTGRGGWKWGSANTVGIDQDLSVGILMAYREGDKLLTASDGNLYEVGEDAPYPISPRGATFAAIQNPIKYNNVVVHFSGTGASLPQLWPYAGAPALVNAAFKNSTVGVTYKTMLVTAGAPGEEHVVRFSVPGINVDLTAATAFDANSFIPTSLPVTALAALRSMILVFHAGSVERIRGAKPPHGTGTNPGDDGDMVVEDLFDNAGCVHPKSIAHWNDNVIFADEHGVHLTDGATIKSLTSQGAISHFWRVLFDGAETICGTVFLDYYMITLRHPVDRPPIPFFGSGEERIELPPLPEPLEDPPRPPVPPHPGPESEIRPPPPTPIGEAYNTTLICDLNRRQWYRVSNLNALTLFGGSGKTGMERVWAGLADYNRLARVGPIFYPDILIPQQDDNGVFVTPRLETPWYRLGKEGRKRVRFAYLSYDSRGTGANPNPVRIGYITGPQQRDYIEAGLFPTTFDYERRRLAVYKAPYGIGFYIQAGGAAFTHRIFDIAVEAQAMEASRV